jgi:hypothetical protein
LFPTFFITIFGHQIEINICYYIVVIGAALGMLYLVGLVLERLATYLDRKQAQNNNQKEQLQ